MQGWDAAGTRIRRRMAADVIRSLEVETPFAYDPSEGNSDVSDFLESEWDALGEAADLVIELPGRDINFARDMLFASFKFYHVLEIAKNAREKGALTWALVEAYHAALLGARAASAFFGVLTYQVKGRTVLVDFRPELGSLDDQKKFRKDYRGLSTPIRILRPKKKLLEQSEAWDLLHRITQICGADKASAEGEFSILLSKIAKKSLSRTRNRILYDSVYWTWPIDFSMNRPNEDNLRNLFVTSEETIRDLISSLAEILAAVKHYIAATAAHLSFDTQPLPECARSDPSILALGGSSR